MRRRALTNALKISGSGRALAIAVPVGEQRQGLAGAFIRGVAPLEASASVDGVESEVVGLHRRRQLEADASGSCR